MDDHDGDDNDVGRCGHIVCEGMLLLWSATVRLLTCGWLAWTDVVDDSPPSKTRADSEKTVSEAVVDE